MIFNLKNIIQLTFLTVIFKQKYSYPPPPQKKKSQ